MITIKLLLSKRIRSGYKSHLIEPESEWPSRKWLLTVMKPGITFWTSSISGKKRKLVNSANNQSINHSLLTEPQPTTFSFNQHWSLWVTFSWSDRSMNVTVLNVRTKASKSFHVICCFSVQPQSQSALLHSSRLKSYEMVSLQFIKVLFLTHSFCLM